MELTEIDEIIKIEIINNNEKNKKLELISIFYKSDDIIVQGYILKKKELTKKVPVIIYCRGGNRSYGEVSIKSQIYRKEFISLVENEKSIIFYPNYRGSSQSQGNDEFGGHDVNDIISLYPIISKYKYCNKDKIALYGWSRGGTMAIKVSTMVDWITTIILGGTLFSMIKMMKERPEMAKLWLETFHLTKNDFKERAPKYLINKIPKHIPILILHGSNDKRVSVEHCYLLGKKCQENNLLYKLIIFPNGDHGLTQYDDDVMTEIIKWIDKYL